MVARADRIVPVAIPEDALARGPRDADELAGELRLLFLIEQVRARRLAYGKAAELAGMTVRAFLLEAGKRGVGAFDYDDGELAGDVGSGA